MSKIQFGTDGFRAVVGEDFNYDNVDKIANAIALYVYNKSKFENKILISYDPRNKADEFGFYIASMFSKFGFEVEIADKITATPVTAYSALLNNAYAIMITASHNPPEYLGIKFIPQYGGPADNSIIKEIVDNLDKKFVSNAQEKNFKLVSFDEDYLKHIYSLIDMNTITKSKISVNYDGHHGAAAHLFKKILDDNNINNTSINMERDINFGGFMPDPKEKYLPQLKELCKKTGRIGLSNDGDGDRFGVFNEKGEFVSANEIIAILLKHLKENKKLTGKLAKTVGASSMLNIAAQNYNTDVIETPVGFKWLAQAMRNDDVLIAGEESGGLSIKGHIPEKDGILANLLIMEVIASTGKKLFELQAELKKIVKRNYINDRIDIKLSSSEEQQKIIDKFKNIDEVLGEKIVNKNDIDGLKLYLDSSDWILIRKSGTEPLLRIYIESSEEEKMAELRNFIKDFC